MSNLLNAASLVLTPNSYKEGKLYSVIPNTGAGDMTVTRATTATRVNSAGLVELVPYNLFQYSEDFSNGYWVKTNATITTNTTAAPNFTLTADTITDNATNGQHKVQTAALSDLVTGASFVASAYIKANTATRACVYAYGTSLGVGVDLLTGNQITVSGLTNASPGQVTITNVGNGWYYIELRATVAGAFSIAIMMVSGTDFSYAGSGNSLYYWGAQLTEGTTAKPYQKTETRLNIPRLDYSNGTCPSLLVEPQRTNLINYSEDFSNSYWAKQGGTLTSNATTAPNGTMTADLFTLGIPSFEHNIYNPSGVTTVANQTYTLSVYVKKGTAQYVAVWIYYTGIGGGPYATFDLDSQTLVANGSGNGTYVGSNITSVGDGWYRISVSGYGNYTSIIAGSPDVRQSGSLIPGVPFVSTGQTIYAWGTQLEAGSYATSYIPTTSASVTRNTDVISKTGISSLIGQFEGTIYWEGIANYGVFPKSNVIIDMRATSGYLLIEVFDTGYIQVSSTGFGSNLLSSVPLPLNTNSRIALTYKAGNWKLYLNGVQVASSTAAIGFSDLNALYIGYLNPAIGYLEKTQVKCVSLWKEALNDEQLESLTGTGFNSYAAMASFYNYTLQ